MAIKQLKSKRIVIRVTPSHAKQFAKAAERADQTVSSWARQACLVRLALSEGAK